MPPHLIPQAIFRIVLIRRSVLASGAVTLIVADVVLARAGAFGWLTVGISLWGLHMGLSQGLLAALVADAAPPERRGTDFGLFNLISGVVVVCQSIRGEGNADSIPRRSRISRSQFGHFADVPKHNPRRRFRRDRELLERVL